MDVLEMALLLFMVFFVYAFLYGVSVFWVAPCFFQILIRTDGRQQTVFIRVVCPGIRKS